MSRLILIIILFLHVSVLAAETENAKLKELLIQYEKLEKAERDYLGKRGDKVTTAELEEIRCGKKKLIVMIEMENPLYQDDFPRNLFPRVIRELIKERGYNIDQAEAMIRAKNPEAQKVFERIADKLHQEERELARIRVMQRIEVRKR
jgi:thioredoxin-related protein